MIEPLSEARYERRKQRAIAILDRLGELDVDEVEGSDTRTLRFVVTAPGYGLPPQAAFDHTERFVRERSRWRLAGYRYEYREEPPAGRLAYHWHDASFHAHCLDPRVPSGDHHYRATAVSFFEAHEEFVRLYAHAEPVSCAQLRPAAVTALELA